MVLDLPSSQGKEVAERLGPEVAFVPADVTDEDQVAEAVAAAQELGTLRAVVNCAGMATPSARSARRGPSRSPTSGGSSRST